MKIQQFNLLAEGDLVTLTCGGPTGSCLSFTEDKGDGGRGMVQIAYVDAQGRVQTANLPFTALKAENGPAAKWEEDQAAAKLVTPVNPGTSATNRPPTRPVRSRQR